MNRHLCELALATTILALGYSPASAAFLDFEDPASKGLSDNSEIGDAYKTSDGVTFDGGYIEEEGEDDPTSGFVNDEVNARDVQNPATPGLGEYFVRSQGDIFERGGKKVYLTITYETPTTAASGQIWDIDGTGPNSTEKWIVEAVAGGNVVDSQTSPEYAVNDETSLDGLPWAFGFDLSQEKAFDTIRFKFDGTKTSNIGLAFDNFNSSSGSITDVPTPAPFVLLATGLFSLGVGVVGRRKA